MMTQNDQVHRMERVFDDVRAERATHPGRGYTEEHDARHTPQEFITYANRQFTKPLTVEGRRSGQWYSRQTFIKAISVLVAGVEAMDARAERNQKHG